MKFTAEYILTQPGVGIPGLEDYNKTHVAISMKSGSNQVPYVLVPVSDPLLPNLKTGEMYEVLGVPKSLKGVAVYVVVQSLARASTL